MINDSKSKKKIPGTKQTAKKSFFEKVDIITTNTEHLI